LFRIISEGPVFIELSAGKHSRSDLPTGEYWHINWVPITIGTVLATSSCGFVAAGRLFYSLRQFRKALVRSLGLIAHTLSPFAITRDGIQWDVFIATKLSEADGAPSRDLSIAENIYASLSERGVRVFFSPRSLELTGVSAFKAAIDDALEQSDVLIVIGTSLVHLESRWVRYEWESFHNEILSGNKPTARIFVLVEGLQPKDLPRSLRQVQAFYYPQDIERLCGFVSNALAQRTAAFRPGERPP
jgi:hypothetical protein